MTIQKNKKVDIALNSLRARQDYLVVQGNALAKSFGNLTAFEHKLLDFCISFIQKDDEILKRYETKAIDIIRHFGLNSSGENYERIIDGLYRLNDKTSLIFPVEDGEYKGVIFTHLFASIHVYNSGNIKFIFSPDVSEVLFNLRKNYYSFKLAELSIIKSKYTLILLKLWESNRYNNQQVTTIQGDFSDWKRWFLGQDGMTEIIGFDEEIPDKWTAGRFKDKVLNVAMKELDRKLNVDIELITHKNGRKVVGYEMRIIDNRQPTTVQVMKQAEQDSYQTDIYDYLG